MRVSPARLSVVPMSDSDLRPRRARLPDVSLPSLEGGTAVPLRARRRGTVLVRLSAHAGEAERSWLRHLAQQAERLESWDGRVLLVAPPDGDARRPDGSAPLPLVRDERGVIEAATGVAAPGVVVADQWGEVHFATAAGDAPWPPLEELEQWLRYISVRCGG